MENPKLSLEARLRLDFTLVQVGPRVPVYSHLIQSAVCMSVRDMFEVEIAMSESDVKFFRSGRSYPDPERRVAGNGRVYFRDLGFVRELAKLKQLPICRVREHLREKLSSLKMTIVGGGRYEFQATLPLCEDPNEMMHLVAHPFTGPIFPIRYPYTLVIRGLPLTWFGTDDDDADSSRPSLFAFFQRLTSANIRNLDTTSENEGNASDVVIQYENYGECYKALKRLCSFSLLKVEKDGSKMIADYEIMWKDSM